MRYFYPIAAIAIALLVCSRLVSSWLQHRDCAKHGRWERGDEVSRPGIRYLQVYVQVFESIGYGYDISGHRRPLQRNRLSTPHHWIFPV